MNGVQTKCEHTSDSHDYSNTQFDVKSLRVWCKQCQRYVEARDKHPLEMASVVAPAVGIGVGVLGLGVGIASALSAKREAEQERKLRSFPCLSCGKTVIPTAVVATPQKLGFLARHGIFSKVEEHYLGCPSCKTALAYCKHCKTFSRSDLKRVRVGIELSRTGYQYEQRCQVCKKKAA